MAINFVLPLPPGASSCRVRDSQKRCVSPALRIVPLQTALSPPQIQGCLADLLHPWPGNAAAMEFLHDCQGGEGFHPAAAYDTNCPLSLLGTML